MSDSSRINMSALVLQAGLVFCCMAALWLFATNFPFPSPLIKSLLPPDERRWPAEQIRQWVSSDTVPRGFLAFFSRDPDRDVPPGLNVVAPADGVIRNIIHMPEWTYIDIALSFWDVHVQRSPVEGVVKSVVERGDTFMNGEYKNMVYLRDKKAPVQKVIDIQSEWGEVKVRLITSFNARRIRVWIHEGEKVDKGQRIGRILLGSTVILQLPPDMPIAVEQWDRVVAGETIISKAKTLP